MRFELGDGDFPAPLVDVVVSGQPTTMIVDTGATHQVIATWVAEQIGPTEKTANVGVDHTGKNVALSKLSGASIVVSGWGAIDATNAMVMKVPVGLQRLGVGGILSPQGFVGSGAAVVLDFRHNVLTEQVEVDALAELNAAPGVPFSGEIQSCGEGGGSLLRVTADVSGVLVVGHLDSGATLTTVRAGSDVGKKLQSLANSSTQAVTASGPVSAPLVIGTKVTVGSHVVTTDVAIVTKPERKVCSSDVLLGMDVLRKCTLVVGSKNLTGKCTAP